MLSPYDFWLNISKMSYLSSQFLKLSFPILSRYSSSSGALSLPVLDVLKNNNGFIHAKIHTNSSLFQSSSDSKSGSDVSFATLFRHSPLVQLGPPAGKVVQGNVVEVVGDDLYIDFGFKFNAVCRRPKINSEKYVRGALVKVRINDLELSDRFLGSSQDMTLLEADVTLLGLVSTPFSKTLKKKQ